MKSSKNGGLAENVAALSAFVQAAGKTLITGLGLTLAERQMARLGAGRMRMWARHVRLQVDETVVLGLENLVADILVNNPDLPLIPERTDQYTCHLLKGTVRLEAATIEAMLERHVFNTGPVPLSHPKLAFDERGVRLEAQLTWGPLHVPILLAGPIKLGEEGQILIEAERVEAAGWGLSPLLALLRTDLESVLHLPPEGPMSASGNQITLDPERIFPAPQTKGRPTAIATDREALYLTYDSPEALGAPPLIEGPADPFLFCLGHALLVGKLYLNDAVFQVVPRSKTVPALDFSLLQYRQQLAAGESTLKQHGEVLVRLPNLDELEAQPYAKLNGRLVGRAQRSAARRRQPEGN